MENASKDSADLTKPFENILPPEETYSERVENVRQLDQTNKLMKELSETQNESVRMTQEAIKKSLEERREFFVDHSQKPREQLKPLGQIQNSVKEHQQSRVEQRHHRLINPVNEFDETMKEHQEAVDTLNEVVKSNHESREKYQEGSIEHDKPQEKQRPTEEPKESFDHYQSTRKHQESKEQQESDVLEQQDDSVLHSHEVLPKKPSSSVQIIEVIKIDPVPEENLLPKIHHTTGILSNTVTDSIPKCPEVDTMQVSNNLENIEMEVADENCPRQETQADTVVKSQAETSVEIQAPDANVVSSGLSLLAQYNSEDDDEEDSDEESIACDTDSESIIEVPLASAEYRNRVVEIDSDSDSDSKSDGASDVEYLNEIRQAIDKSIDDVDAEDDEMEDECGGKTKRQPLRVKGEFLIDDLPPIQDLHITVPEEECIELGKVHSIVEQLVLVSALPDSILLDLDTVLFLDKGKRVLGEVFDVLGQVADPLYCVRFNSNEQIKEKHIQVGDVVFVAPKTEHTQFIILSNLMKMRGSDASWENDIEPPPQFLAYSDDEQEKAARAKLRNRNRNSNNNDTTKRLRSEIIEDISSPPSPSPSPMPVELLPSPYHRQPFNQQHQPRAGGGGGRGGGRGRRGGDYRPPRYPHNSQNYHSPNYNSGSWHSHYPQHYAVPRHHYGGPQHVMYPQPPNFPPHAMHGGQPYAVRTQPPPPQILQQPPPPLGSYRPNLYEARNPALDSSNHEPAMFAPPPPPPGAQ